MSEDKLDPNYNETAIDVTLPLQRSWLKAKPNPQNEEDTKRCQFSVVTYNILADGHTLETHYPYCSRQHFKAVQRLPQLLRELDHHGADIICMQEVDQHIYRDHLEPHLLKKGYNGLYVQRKMVGNATFFKKSCFELIDERKIELSNSLAKEIENQDIIITDLDTVLMNSKPMLFSRLRCKKSGYILNLGNVHLTFNSYKSLDITALEASLAIRHVTKQSAGAPHLLCGDFNQEPFMPGYQILQNGHLSDKDKEVLREFPLDPAKNGSKENSLVEMIPELFSHNSKHLKSAYKTVVGHEVPFSNHEDAYGSMKFPSFDDNQPIATDLPEDDACPAKKKMGRRLYQSMRENYGKEVFIGALDYLWYGSDKLYCTGVLDMVDEKKIEQFHSAPNIVFPSDHLLMKAEFEFVAS